MQIYLCVKIVTLLTYLHPSRKQETQDLPFRSWNLCFTEVPSSIPCIKDPQYFFFFFCCDFSIMCTVPRGIKVLVIF